MGEPDHNYPYSKYIKSPQQLGASAKGTMSALKKDIAVLGDYVDVMVSGTTKAQIGGQPLGNKYFLPTNTDCKDAAGVAHPRYIFINNIPQMMAGSTSRGLVPGILGDIAYINPSKLFAAFTQSNVCRQVTMETRDINNVVGTETQYVLDDDLKTYPYTWFKDQKNPITLEGPIQTGKDKGKKGKKGKDKDKKGKKEKFTNPEEDITISEFIFYFGFFLLVMYIVANMLKKTRSKN